MTPPTRDDIERSGLGALLVLVGLLLVMGGLVAAAIAVPAGATPVRPARAAPRAIHAMPDQVPPSPIPVEDDVPVAGNGPSPILDDLELSGDEYDARSADLDRVVDRRDDAIATQDRLRRQIEQLRGERVAEIAELVRRRDAESARGRERAAAVDRHRRRVEAATAARKSVIEARERLRELAVSRYVSASSARTDVPAAVAGDGDMNAALTRRTYGGSGVRGRQADLRARERERRAAVRARDRAQLARARAEQAERDAVSARRATETHIEEIDTDTARAQQEEVAAVEDVSRKEAAILVALADLAPARLRADVEADGIDFQLVALDAWLKAAAAAPCRIEWWALAGISKIEGRHGRFGGGRLGVRGYPSVTIIGPALNGFGGFARIADTDGGRYDGDTVYDRAVGPMQFIPSTWERWGRDGDGDGVADPHTIYDAAAAAAAYLCSGRSDLTDEAQLRAAYFSYNHSAFYVAVVHAAARDYQAALTIEPDQLPPPP